MPETYPDLEWYAKISAQKGLSSPRCPYAVATRCPRYYQSLYLLGQAGSTKIEEADDKRLEAFWKKSDLWPLTAEQATSMDGPEGRKTFSRFCPEVAFERFGLFASHLIPYPDVETSELAQERLASSSGALSRKDYRWDWWGIQETHYSECSLFALLPYTAPVKSSVSPDAELLEMKPSVAGFSVNLKVLLTKLAGWWLKKQTPK